MDPITIAIIIGAVAPIAAQLIGDAVAAGDKEKAMRLANEAAEKYKTIVVPKLKELEATKQGRTELEGASKTLDQTGRNAQLRALDLLGETVEGNGMTAQDTAAFQAARGAAGSMDTGFRQAAAQRNAQMGRGGQQSDYLSALLGGQQAANLGARMTGDAAAAAADRRMQAVNSLGNFGGNLSTQDWGRARDVGSAQDYINRYNTDLATNRDKYNNDQAQRGFTNQLTLADTQAGALRDQSNLYGDRAADTKRQAAAYGAAAKSAADGVAGGIKGQQDAKYEAWKRKQEGYG